MIKSVATCLLGLTIFFLYACSDSPGSSSIKNLPVYPGSVEVLENQKLLAWVGGVNIKYFESTDDYTSIMKFYSERLPSYEQETMSDDSKEGRMVVFSRTANKIITSVFVMEMKEEDKVLISFNAFPED